MQTNLARDHVLFHHDPKDTEGWITMARKDPQTHRFVQFHYQPQELATHLSKWTGEDVYYSQNTFFKPQRRIDNIRQLRSLFVDLDVYTLGLSPEWVLGKLEYEYFGQSIPDPNMVIFSGRGLVLIWHLVPIPYMVMPLWRAVENHFSTLLKDLGADPKATDPTRIFRLAGTINSKNGQTVTAQYRHAYRYDIHDLQYEYLPELTPPAPDKPKKRGRKSKVINLFNIYTLHLSRARDIGRLVELRQGKVEGHREIICFLYRYFTCCYSSDPAQALRDTLSLNEEFANPLPTREVERATASAQKAWEAKSNKEADETAKAMGYPGAGYNLKTSKIIEWLDISPEEQKELSNLIGTSEKNRRRRVKYRAEVGLSPKQKKLNQIAAILREEPGLSDRKLAEKSGLSRSTVQRLRREI